MYENPVKLAKQIRDIFNAKFKGQQREAGVNPLQLPNLAFPPAFHPMAGGTFLGQRPAPAVSYDPALSPNMPAPTFPASLAIRPTFMPAQGILPEKMQVPVSPYNLPGQRFPAPVGGPPSSSAPNLNKLLESLLGVKKED